MSYRLKENEGFSEGIKRILLEQLDEGLHRFNCIYRSAPATARGEVLSDEARLSFNTPTGPAKKHAVGPPHIQNL